MMTNKKLIFGIVVTIVVVGIGLSIFNRYDVFRPEITSTPTSNITSSTTQTEASLECPLDEESEYIVITDVFSSLAISSRTILLESGLSEKYLNEHFSFLCGIEYSSDNHRVAWKYVIGEYETILEGILNAPQKTGPKFSKVVGKLHDIQSVISRIRAEKKMEQCLGEKPANIRVTLVGGPAPYPRSRQGASQNNENGGLFMIGSPDSKSDPNDPSALFWKIGFLNLETKKCTTEEGISVEDTLPISN